VIASDIPGYRDVLRDGIDGLLTPPGDALALAQALRRVALDPAGRARMAAAARERAARFAWPRVAAEVLDCYEEACAVGRPATRLARAAVRFGLAPADLRPRVPPRRLPSLEGPAAHAPRIGWGPIRPRGRSPADVAVTPSPQRSE
jgi:phosphatidylinositol alpha-mannosyltransferase